MKGLARIACFLGSAAGLFHDAAPQDGVLSGALQHAGPFPLHKTRRNEEFAGEKVQLPKTVTRAQLIQCARRVPDRWMPRAVLE